MTQKFKRVTKDLGHFHLSAPPPGFLLGLAILLCLQDS